MNAHHLVQRLLAVLLLTALHAATAQTEEQILKKGGTEAKAVIEKAYWILGGATSFEIPVTYSPERCWALTVIVRYAPRADAVHRLHDQFTHGDSSAVQKLYAFAGLRLLGEYKKAVREEVWSKDTLKERVSFQDGCTGSQLTVREVLDYLDTYGYEILLLKPLPRLYRTL